MRQSKSVFCYVVFACIFAVGCKSTEPEQDADLDALATESTGSSAQTVPDSAVGRSTTGSTSYAEVKGLPLPSKPLYFTVRSFMDEYKDAYAAFSPLSKEFKAYFKTLNEAEEPSEESIAALKMRLRENTDRSHWVFLGAILELEEFLLEGSRTMLHVDKEENFISRMRVITFMAAELKEITKQDRYVEFARAVYRHLNEKYFGRVVKPREQIPKPAPLPAP